MRTTFGALGSLLRVVAGVRLRREHFGGIVFAVGTGTTVDVDRPVFSALDNLRQRGVQGEEALVRQLCGGRNDAHQLTEAQRLLSQLVDSAILAAASEADMKQAAKPESPEFDTAELPDVCWPSGPHLPAPVTVHWAVTHQCALQCPECYVRRYAQGFSEELTLPESLRLVKILADWEVFELAIGGGEPLEFPLFRCRDRRGRPLNSRPHLGRRLGELRQEFVTLNLELKALEAGLAEGTRVATLRRLISWSAESLQRAERLVLVPARARLEAITVESVDLDSEDAFQVALANRLDFMNGRAALVDQWRLIQVSADALQSVLTVTGSGDLRTARNNPVSFRAPTGSQRLGVDFDAPFTRLLERNAYRESLIAYQQSRRSFIRSRDSLHLGLRAAA